MSGNVTGNATTGNPQVDAMIQTLAAILPLVVIVLILGAVIDTILGTFGERRRSHLPQYAAVLGIFALAVVVGILPAWALLLAGVPIVASLFINAGTFEGSDYEPSPSKPEPRTITLCAYCRGELRYARHESYEEAGIEKVYDTCPRCFAPYTPITREVGA